MDLNFCYSVTMQIHVGADHRGVELKGELMKWLTENGHMVTDWGAKTVDEDDDYPDYAVAVASAVVKDPGSVGITICGSGVGMAVAADKVLGIRAGLIHDPAIAEAARRDDNINVLALGADFINTEQAKKVLGAWLKESFSGQARHQRRLDKISAYETHDPSAS